MSAQLPMPTDDRVTVDDLGRFIARELVIGVLIGQYADEVLLPGHAHQIKRLLAYAPSDQIERLGLDVAPKIKIKNKHKRRGALEEAINRACCGATLPEGCAAPFSTCCAATLPEGCGASMQFLYRRAAWHPGGAMSTTYAGTMERPKRGHFYLGAWSEMKELSVPDDPQRDAVYRWEDIVLGEDPALAEEDVLGTVPGKRGITKTEARTGAVAYLEHLWSAESNAQIGAFDLAAANLAYRNRGRGGSRFRMES